MLLLLPHLETVDRAGGNFAPAARAAIPGEALHDLGHRRDKPRALDLAVVRIFLGIFFDNGRGTASPNGRQRWIPAGE